MEQKARQPTVVKGNLDWQTERVFRLICRVELG